MSRSSLRLFLFALIFSSFAWASGDKPFNLSLTRDISIFPHQRITGATLSVWGENETHGLSLGFVNGTVGRSAGASIGLVNYADEYTGAQLGVFNWGKRPFEGLQVGLVNYCAEAMTGAQWGVVNYTEKMSGLQVGLFNYARVTEAGVQVGLINVIQANTSFFGEFPKSVAPFMILANWRFR